VISISVKVYKLLITHFSKTNVFSVILVRLDSEKLL